MKDQDLSGLGSPEDLLRAENAVLKLKLETEHHMQGSKTENLPPEVENEWLKHIYEFEQQFRRNKQMPLYDFIGRPRFDTVDRLSPVEIPGELARLQCILGENGIELDTLCEYDDDVIYRFITEELFQHTVDDIRIPGMTTHFIYEEFHPNHDYDLRKRATEFVTRLLKRKWDSEFDEFSLAEELTLFGVRHSREEAASLLMSFQASRRAFRRKSLNIHHVSFDLEQKSAVVTGHLAYGVKSVDASERYEGDFRFEFMYDGECWRFSLIEMP